MERRRRKELDELTEKENAQVKAAKQGAGGRKALISGNFISGGIMSSFRGGTRPAATGRRSGAGNILSSAGRVMRGIAANR